MYVCMCVCVCGLRASRLVVQLLIALVFDLCGRRTEVLMKCWCAATGMSLAPVMLSITGCSVQGPRCRVRRT